MCVCVCVTVESLCVYVCVCVCRLIGPCGYFLRSKMSPIVMIRAMVVCGLVSVYGNCSQLDS